MTEDDFMGGLYQRFPVTIEKGVGAHVWDIDGKEYIDCMGGYGVAIVGHQNKRVVKAIKEQVDKIITVHSSLYNKTREEFLNVDGDRAAAYVAGSVGSDKVLFITNVNGLLMDDKLVTKLTLAEAKEIRPKIGPGMEKKILASTEALDMGVKEALIANGQRENPISAAIAHDNCTVIQHD